MPVVSRSLGDDDVAPVALEEFLELDAKSRMRKTPFITVGEQPDEVRYRVNSSLVEMAEKRIQTWRTLQELAGVVTPFTAKVEQEIQARVAGEHQAELDAQETGVRAKNLQAPEECGDGDSRQDSRPVA